MERIKVLITVPELEDQPELFAGIPEISPRIAVEQRVCKTDEEVTAILQGVEILYTQRVPVHLEQADRLKWVNLGFTGIDTKVKNPIFDPDRGIIVTNGAGAHGVAIPEYCMMTLGMLARDLLQLYRDQQAQIRDRSHSPLNDLWGKTIGIVGYGHIGSEVARLAAAHHMRILAVKRHPDRHAGRGYQWRGVGDAEGVLPERFYGPDDLHEVLGQSDYVVCCVPLTPETRGLFGDREFEAMKPEAYFVNVGRGATVDDMALARALQGGTVAAAACDVFATDPKPLPPEHPLWTLDNMFISPHISGNRNDLYFRKLNDIFRENLLRYLKEQPLVNVVTRERGY